MTTLRRRRSIGLTFDTARPDRDSATSPDDRRASASVCRPIRCGKSKVIGRSRALRTGSGRVRCVMRLAGRADGPELRDIALSVGRCSRTRPSRSSVHLESSWLSARRTCVSARRDRDLIKLVAEQAPRAVAGRETAPCRARTAAVARAAPDDASDAVRRRERWPTLTRSARPAAVVRVTADKGTNPIVEHRVEESLALRPDRVSTYRRYPNRGPSRFLRSRRPSGSSPFEDRAEPPAWVASPPGRAPAARATGTASAGCATDTRAPPIRVRRCVDR